MAFTTSSRTRAQRPDRKERHRQTVAKIRARGRDLRGAMQAEGAPFEVENGLPKVGSPDRKARCAESIAAFAETYLPRVFNLPMSEGQRRDFDTMRTAIVEGGRYAFAAPRGDGKTSRVEAAILWAALYGHRRCIVVVGADLTAAQEIVESVKLEIRTNELLREDFPVPCWAATLAEDTALKAKGWTWAGESLFMRWGKGGIVLPVLDGADGSGCVIVPRGLTGRLRGMRLKVGKRAVRPDLYAIDDPQTDESAASPAQVDTRENLILGAIMGSGGPAATIAAMMPCTIIRHDDLAARFLDRKRRPDWQGSTRGLVRRWPDAQKTLWKEYTAKRREDGPEAADAFYAENQQAMDAGGEVDWPERFTRGKERTAMQHAQNLLCDLGEDVFAAEYQNEPREKDASVYDLNARIVASRVHTGRPPLVLPQEARTIIAATDINHYGLHSAVIGFANDQTAWIPWYGRYDKGGRGIVPKNCPEMAAKQLIYAALVAHGQELRNLQLTQGDQMARVACWIIDAGYAPDVVRRYITGEGRALGMAVLSSKGFSADYYRPNPRSAIGAPMEQCHRAESEKLGRFIAFNSDYWREVSQKAWLGLPNSPGSLSLYEGGSHKEFSEQVTREPLVEKLIGKTGPIWRWGKAIGWHDWGDAVTLAYVAAAVGGVGTIQGGHQAQRTRNRRPTVRMVKV